MLARYNIPDMTDINFYADSEPVTRGRKLGALVLDYLTLLILTLLFFVASDAIGQQTGSVKSLTDQASQSRDNLYSLVESSKLDEVDDSTGGLVGSSALVKRNIYEATLASLKKNGKTDISQATYAGYDAITPETDNAYYFYTSFKKANKENFSLADEDRAVADVASYRSLLVSKVTVDYFETGDYPYLTLANAEALDNYLRDDTYAIGKTIYDNLTAGYGQLLSLGSQEFITYYAPYVKENQTFTDKTTLLYKIKHCEVLVSYVLGILLVYFAAPLILKNGMTTTDKILKIGVTTSEGKTPSWLSLLGHSLLLAVAYVSVLPLVFFCYYGVNALSLLDISLLPNVSLMILGLASLLLMIFSFVLTFINPNRKQTISEFLSGQIMKDGRVFVVSRTINEDPKNTHGNP